MGQKPSEYDGLPEAPSEMLFTHWVLEIPSLGSMVWKLPVQSVVENSLMSPPLSPLIEPVWVFLTQKHCLSASLTQKRKFWEPELFLMIRHLNAKALELSASNNTRNLCMVVKLEGQLAMNEKAREEEAKER